MSETTALAMATKCKTLQCIAQKFEQPWVLVTLAMPLAPGVPFLMLSALKSYLTTRPLLLLTLAVNMPATIRSCNQVHNPSLTK